MTFAAIWRTGTMQLAGIKHIRDPQLYTRGKSAIRFNVRDDQQQGIGMQKQHPPCQERLSAKWLTRRMKEFSSGETYVRTRNTTSSRSFGPRLFRAWTWAHLGPGSRLLVVFDPRNWWISEGRIVGASGRGNTGGRGHGVVGRVFVI